MPADREHGRTMTTEPYILAELEAACKAVHELEDMTVDRYLSVKQEVAAAFRAVLPDHDAWVRADERARVSKEIARALLERDPVEWALSGQHAGEDAANIARYHRDEPP